MRKYVISLAHGSLAFKWASNTVRRWNRIAVCSTFFFCFRMYTHVPFIQESLTCSRGLGASFIHTGRMGLEWLPGHIPVCCRVSSTEPWHFTRPHTHAAHPSQRTRSTQTRIFRAFPTKVKPKKTTKPTSDRSPKVISLKERGIRQRDGKIFPKSLIKYTMSVWGNSSWVVVLPWHRKESLLHLFPEVV